jgi:hypothetical protein
MIEAFTAEENQYFSAINVAFRRFRAGEITEAQWREHCVTTAKDYDAEHGAFSAVTLQHRATPPAPEPESLPAPPVAELTEFQKEWMRTQYGVKYE